MTVTGTVVWFNSGKGYGFLSVDGEEKQVFVHHSGINMQGFRELKEGQRVEFKIVKGPKGPQAEQVTVI